MHNVRRTTFLPVPFSNLRCDQCAITEVEWMDMRRYTSRVHAITKHKWHLLFTFMTRGHQLDWRAGQWHHRDQLGGMGQQDKTRKVKVKENDLKKKKDINARMWHRLRLVYICIWFALLPSQGELLTTWSPLKSLTNPEGGVFIRELVWFQCYYVAQSTQTVLRPSLSQHAWSHPATSLDGV